MFFLFRPVLVVIHHLLSRQVQRTVMSAVLLLGSLLAPIEVVATDKSLHIEDVTNELGVKGLRATFQLHASRTEIWDLLTDYDRFTETFKRIHSLEVINHDEQGALVHFNIKVLFLTFDYTLQRNYERPLERLTWHRTAGDFRQITGSWEILPGPEENLHIVVFESFVDVGYMIPTAMVRRRAASELEATVKQIRARLERGQRAAAID